MTETANYFLSQKEKKEIIPDEYGYFYSNQVRVLTTQKSFSIPKELRYIGNFKIEKPKNEYLLSSDLQTIILVKWEDIDILLTNNYYDYNLKNTSLYDKDVCQNWHNQEQLIRKNVDSFLKSIREKKVEFKEEKKKKGDTLTYVGGDPNHPDYKCKIKKED